MGNELIHFKRTQNHFNMVYNKSAEVFNKWQFQQNTSAPNGSAAPTDERRLSRK